MMNQPRLLRTCLIGTLTLTLIAAVARSIAFFTSFDRTVGYFDPSVFSTLLYIAVALAVIISLAYALLSARAAKTSQAMLPCPDISARSRLLRAATALVALAFVGIAAYEIPNVLSGGIISLALLRLLSAACTAPYFASFPKRNTMLSGVCIHVYCFTALITEYFDHYVTMNSPLKLMQQFAFFSIMLYMLTELRQLSDARQPVRSISFGLVAVFFTVTNGISCVAAAFAGGIIPVDYLLRALLLMSLGLYILVRFFPLLKSTSKEIA